MGEGGIFYQAFVYLAAAVVAVPIAKRLGLGSVLGYLFATGMTLMYNQFFDFPDLTSDLHLHTYVVGMAVSLLAVRDQQYRSAFLTVLGQRL